MSTKSTTKKLVSKKSKSLNSTKRVRKKDIKEIYTPTPGELSSFNPIENDENNDNDDEKNDINNKNGYKKKHVQYKNPSDCDTDLMMKMM